MTQTQEILILAAMILVGFVVGSWLIIDLRKKVNKLYGGKMIKDEGANGNLVRRLMKTEVQLEALEPRVEILEKISTMSVQKMSFLRFNPFQDTGGDQSFILALLDQKNNGVILSSLYTREGVRVYGKEIVGGESKHSLSAEEKIVLKEALNK